MGPAGLEPTCLAAADFKSAASANFATGPLVLFTRSLQPPSLTVGINSSLHTQSSHSVFFLEVTTECESLRAHYLVHEVCVATRGEATKQRSSQHRCGHAFIIGSSERPATFA